MKNVNNHRVSLRMSAMALAVILGTSTLETVATPFSYVSAAEITISASTATQSEHDYLVRFHLLNGENESVETFYANQGDTYGPDGTISVRSTFYKDGVDYDLKEDGSSPLSKAADIISGDLDFYYIPHSESEIKYEINAVVKNGNEGKDLLLKSVPVSFKSSDGDQTMKLEDLFGGTFTYDGVTYTTSEKEVKLSAVQGTEVVEVEYTASGESQEDHYSCKVHYVNADTNEELDTRFFYVNGRKHYYYAPVVYSSDNTGKVYRAKDRKACKIVADPTGKDGSREQEFTVYYTEDTKSAYDWYIMLYDSSTNNLIKVDKVKVEPGTTATYKPEAEVEQINEDGSKQTWYLNQKFDETLKHDYKSNNRVSNVYYNPTKDFKTDALKRDITVQYIDIATGNVIHSEVSQVNTSGESGELKLTFPEKWSDGSVNYVKIGGQLDSDKVSYYSPRNTYNIYYRDENNTAYEPVTIVHETILETDVWDGTTEYTVLPGITRVITVNSQTGERNVIGTTNAQGRLISQNIGNQTTNLPIADNGNNGNNANDANNGTAGTNDANGENTETAENAEDADSSVDGIDSEDVTTPASKIPLTEKDTNQKKMQIIIYVSIVMAAVIIAFLAAFLLTRKKRKEIDNDQETKGKN